MKIGIAQINPVVADIMGNRGKILSCIKSSKELGVELLVFPELATIGYPPMDLLENRKLIAENIKTINAIASESTDIAVICGYADVDPDNPPMLFNAAAFMADGKIISKHYKTRLPSYDVFDERRYFSPAKEQNIIEYNGRKIGITICEDIWVESEFIEFRKYETDPVKVLVDKGADIMINLSASPFVKGKDRARREIVSKIAAKYSLPVVYVNQTGGNDSLVFDGNSFFVNSSGVVTCCAAAFKEDMKIADEDSSNEVVIEYSEMESIRKALVLGTRDYLHKCGFEKAVIGLSGGIDSALTAAIAVEALGPENVFGVTMPSMYSSKGSVDDSVKLAENLEIKIETIPISDIFKQFISDLAPAFKGMDEDVTEENIQARIRGTLLMSISNKTGSMLLATGNKSELSMGYCTLYGDMCGGLAVISDLPKTLVYDLSRQINLNKEIIPFSTIEKPPSAELRPGQKDEDSLPPYDILDNILEMFVDQGFSADEIADSGVDPELVRDILRIVNLNEYKRKQAAPGLKVTSKAFGSGRRIPIVQRFIP